MTPRIILVGASGLIGSHFAKVAQPEFAVVGVTRHTTPSIDITSPASIADYFSSVSDYTHVVVTAGNTSFAPLHELNESELMMGIRSKMLGQMHITLESLRRLPPHGSITLTSGITGRRPIPSSAGTSFVNGALDSFTKAVSLELTEGRRINIISPGWIITPPESARLEHVHRTSVEEVANAYLEVLHGDSTGQVFEI